MLIFVCAQQTQLLHSHLSTIMGQTFSREEIPSGPWDKDMDLHPNEHEWTSEVTGYKCELKRNMNWVWCGYVYLPKQHPDFAKKYQELEKEISVHGDLTHGRGDGCFGFDCGHLMDRESPDLCPTDALLSDSIKVNDEILTCKPTYKTFEFAKAETERMALQFYKRTST